ncbi:hypothetical protein BGW38_005283 [Lunasporangiospora selenospora]|uniref:Uncharacterized protein n=1 Tax=Lunasporangiospora selenospora TaxID=979761 RepID=A0A9P6FPD3_9FUNG|nr:hypothetical protein BGW38_005283 [Lunasporangiospora selenospora]
MSSVLPNSTKIGHYQEVSGFFVAYFGSNGSYSSSPKTSTEVMTNGADRDGSSTRIPEGQDEVKSRRGLETIDGQDYSGTETTTATDSDDKETKPESEGNSTDSLSSNYASLSVHAFSLDTTWPVPRMLAQQFWFPHAHGIIYIVDATRKNEPRGMDHLLNARQFLASLVVDQTLGGPNNNGRKARSSIPLVVFANKAGMDEETCFRVDEIAEILGCEEWDDLSATNGGSGQSQEGRSSSDSASSAGNSLATSRPWCVKSTRSDGAGEGLRESVEWLKSRMGEVWRS